MFGVILVIAILLFMLPFIFRFIPFLLAAALIVWLGSLWAGEPEELPPED